MKCTTHQKSLELFCFDCNLQLCAICVVSHKNHQFDTFEKAGSKMKKEIIRSFFNEEKKSSLKKQYTTKSNKIEQLKKELNNLEIEQTKIKTELDEFDAQYNQVENLQRFQEIFNYYQSINKKKPKKYSKEEEEEEEEVGRGRGMRRGRRGRGRGFVQSFYEEEEE